jgi:hypothetical protein
MPDRPGREPPKSNEDVERRQRAEHDAAEQARADGRKVREHAAKLRRRARIARGEPESDD